MLISKAKSCNLLFILYCVTVVNHNDVGYIMAAGKFDAVEKQFIENVTKFVRQVNKEVKFKKSDSDLQKQKKFAEMAISVWNKLDKAEQMELQSLPASGLQDSSELYKAIKLAQLHSIFSQKLICADGTVDLSKLGEQNSPLSQRAFACVGNKKYVKSNEFKQYFSLRSNMPALVNDYGIIAGRSEGKELTSRQEALRKTAEKELGNGFAEKIFKDYPYAIVSAESIDRVKDSFKALNKSLEKESEERTVKADLLISIPLDDDFVKEKFEDKRVSAIFFQLSLSNIDEMKWLFQQDGLATKMLKHPERSGSGVEEEDALYTNDEASKMSKKLDKAKAQLPIKRRESITRIEDTSSFKASRASSSSSASHFSSDLSPRKNGDLSPRNVSFVELANGHGGNRKNKKSPDEKYIKISDLIGVAGCSKSSGSSSPPGPDSVIDDASIVPQEANRSNNTYNK